MKKLFYLAALAVVAFSCADDNPPVIVEKDPLITPQLNMLVSTTNGVSPLTGVLTISPCQPNSSIYYGNYVSNTLTPLSAYYYIKDGTYYEDSANRVISLPAGTYNMVYWGMPVYEEPQYTNPIVREPAYSIGADMTLQKFSLVKMPTDTTYYPAFDMVHAVKSADVGTEPLSASLQRVVAGLKVIVKDQDNGVLSSSISSMTVCVTNIASELNFYTGKPQGNPCSVSFPLQRSVDGTEMSCATVMLFPSFGKPEFQLYITLKNGTVKTFKQVLSSPLDANTKLTLTLTLGDVFSEESTGDFTVSNWNEYSQTIDISTLN